MAAKMRSPMIGIRQHETGGVEIAGEALIKLVELARRDGEAAMMQQLGIALDAQAAAVAGLGLGAQPGRDEALRVARQQPLGARHQRSAQQQLVGIARASRRAKLGLDEHGRLVVLEIDVADRQRGEA